MFVRKWKTAIPTEIVLVIVSLLLFINDASDSSETYSSFLTDSSDIEDWNKLVTRMKKSKQPHPNASPTPVSQIQLLPLIPPDTSSGEESSPWELVFPKHLKKKKSRVKRSIVDRSASQPTQSGSGDSLFSGSMVFSTDNDVGTNQNHIEFVESLSSSSDEQDEIVVQPRMEDILSNEEQSVPLVRYRKIAKPGSHRWRRLRPYFGTYYTAPDWNCNQNSQSHPIIPTHHDQTLQSLKKVVNPKEETESDNTDEKVVNNDDDDEKKGMIIKSKKKSSKVSGRRCCWFGF